MASGEILIKWVSESAGAVRDMNRLNKAFGDTESKFDKARRGIDRAGTIAAGALAGMAAAGFKAIKSAEEAATANAALAQVYKSMGYPQLADDAKEYAEELSRQLAVEDEVIKAAQTKLATFEDVAASADLMQRSTTVAADLAAAGFGDMSTVAVGLGKALQDPVKGMSLLTRQGSLTKDQQTAIADEFERTGDKAAAQASILAALEKQVGGVGRASRNASDGIKVAWGEIEEAAGTALMEGTIPVLGRLEDRLWAISDWINKNPDTFTKIAGGIAGITAALVALKAALSVITTLQSFMGLLKRFPKGAGLAVLVVEITALVNILKDVDTSAGGAAGALKRFWDLKAPFNGDWWVTRGITRLKDALVGLEGWMDRTFPKLQGWLEKFTELRPAGWITDALGSFFGGRSLPLAVPQSSVPAAPALSSAQIGRISQPAPAMTGGGITVFVDGQSRPARVRQEPVWQPHVTLGVI